VPSAGTATRGPGTVFAIAPGSRVNPALSLPIRIAATGLPAGSAITAPWLPRRVPVPMTASAVSASMAIRPPVSFQGLGPTPAPARAESPGGTSVTGHASGRTGL
jgi:hypothetical protein